MSAPEIGTTVSEGYQRGLDRIEGWLPFLLVIGVVAGVVSGTVAQAQHAVLPNADEILRAAFSGKKIDADPADLRSFGLIGAVGTAVLVLLTWTAYGVLGGRAHRERHGEQPGDMDLGAAIREPIVVVGRLLPTLALIVGGVLLAQVLGAVLGDLGSLLGLVIWIVLAIRIVRWSYAPVIAGSGEAAGAAAYERSASAVAGSWWRTFGVLLVAAIAVGVPTAIAALIVGRIVPGVFLGSFASTLVLALLNWPIMACALESAWSQVEASAPARDDALPPADNGPQSPPAPGPDGPFV